MEGTFLRAVGRGAAGYLGRCCPCAGRCSLLSQHRPTPRSVLVVPDELRYPDLSTTGLASSCVTRPPYDLPSTTASSPRPEHRRAGAHRGQPAWAPPTGRSPALPTPSSASNRRLVSPSTSSTHSPAKGVTGVAQFRRAAPAGPPRDHIAKQKFFSRASLQLETQIVNVLWLFLVNCVENRRKIRKIQNQICWIRCELSHNFCYSYLS
jgi:hypothetical protein